MLTNVTETFKTCLPRVSFSFRGQRKSVCVLSEATREPDKSPQFDAGVKFIRACS